MDSKTDEALILQDSIEKRAGVGTTQNYPESLAPITSSLCPPLVGLNIAVVIQFFQVKTVDEAVPSTVGPKGPWDTLSI